jgi:hypothetical protein
MGRLLFKNAVMAAILTVAIGVGPKSVSAGTDSKGGEAQSISLNLAKDSTKEFDLDPGTTFRVVLRNALPHQKYTIRYKTDNFESAPLPMFSTQLPQSSDKGTKSRDSDQGIRPDQQKLISQLRQLNPFLPDSTIEQIYDLLNQEKCKAIFDALVNVYAGLYKRAKSEDEIQPLQDSIAKSIGIVNDILHQNAPCKDDKEFETYYPAAIKTIYARTLVQQDTVLQIAKGQMIEIIVSRPDSMSVPMSNSIRKIPYTKEWHFYFFSGRKSDFEIVYGFDFITHGSSHTKEYFLQKSGDSGSVITGNNPQGLTDLDFSPTIFAAWFPRKTFAWGGARFGFLAGLSSNNSSLAVSLGGLISWHKNIGVAVGWTAHKANVLRPEFESSDHRFVRDIADVKGVLREVYRLDPFFGVVFRFTSSPFGK